MLVLAGRTTELDEWLVQNQIIRKDVNLLLVPDLYFAIRMIQSNNLQMEVKEQDSAMQSASDSAKDNIGGDRESKGQ